MILPDRDSAVKVSATVQRLRRGLVLRANSVLITIFGDVIAPRRQAVWLGSLIELAGMFGLSGRLVRTSAFRLGADNWLQVQRIGRRSFYGLSDVGRLRAEHADRRIYEFNLPAWDGHWTMVLLNPGLPASARALLRRELLWESFGQLAPLVFAHPHVNHQSLQDILKEAKAQGQVAVLRARSIEPYATGPLQTIMHRTFELTQVERAWKEFIARFAPLRERPSRLTEPEAFFARILLIHEYRRVLLRDPNLPEAFLPAEWPGVRARALCDDIYRGLLPASESFLQATVQTLDGALADTPAAILQRLAALSTRAPSSSSETRS
ncbi:MAG: phenylacetic acid degradation operon negative regulatory protein PaaX [Burkholderiaceae bacterium]